jgi:hypothetical protein
VSFVARPDEVVDAGRQRIPSQRRLIRAGTWKPAFQFAPTAARSIIFEERPLFAAEVYLAAYPVAEPAAEPVAAAVTLATAVAES